MSALWRTMYNNNKGKEMIGLIKTLIICITVILAVRIFVKAEKGDNK